MPPGGPHSSPVVGGCAAIKTSANGEVIKSHYYNSCVRKHEPKAIAARIQGPGHPGSSGDLFITKVS